MGSGQDTRGIRRIIAAERRKLERTRTLIWAGVVILVICTVIFTFFQTILGIGRITESSMLPILEIDDYIVYNRLYGMYEVGDIAVFKELNSRTLHVKRVIAISGDTVDIPADGGLYINGQLVREPYLYYGVETKPLGDMTFPLIVPDGYVFVLGDNRGESIDSRWNRVGLVRIGNISGKLIYPEN